MGDGYEAQGYWYTDDEGNQLVGYEPSHSFTSALDIESSIDNEPEPGTIVIKSSGGYSIYPYEKESYIEARMRAALELIGIDYVRQSEYQHEDGYLCHADFAITRGRHLVIEMNGDDVHCFPGKYPATYKNKFGRLAAEVWAEDAARTRSLNKLGYNNVLTIWWHETVGRLLPESFARVMYEHTSFTYLQGSFTQSFFCNCGAGT